MATRNLSYAAATTITIPTGEDGVQRMGITVSNDSGGNLTTFVLSVRTGMSSVFHTIASAAGDFTTPVSPLLRMAGTPPVTMGDGTVSFIYLDCYGISSVRIVASAAVSAEVSLG